MRKKFFRSLKVQLPYAFATMSLITTSLIGLVLYIIIWNYYSGLEVRNLDTNIHDLVNNLTGIARAIDIDVEDSIDDYGDIFQGQSELTAFLIQSRVKIMDSDHEIIADSGSPSESWTIPLSQLQSNESIPGITDLENNAININKDPAAFSIRGSPAILGFPLLHDAVQEYDRRSELVVEAPFLSNEGDILGYVEISESPNYSREIIVNVMRGLLVASLIGITVAHAFGFFMGRYMAKPLLDLQEVATEMKKGNFEIRSTIQDPEELASLSETFNQMAAQIQQNIDTLRQFVSDAAHEIRTPLTALHADLNLAMSEKSLDKVKPMVDRSLEQIKRLDWLTKDLLDLSRLESRDEEVVMRKINLSDKIMEICEIHASAAEQAGLEFQVDIPPQPIFINADPHQIQRAVGNLINNAVKFSHIGGIVTLKMYTESGSVIILVEDDGIGIPAEEREILFNRFHRGKNTQNYPGSGLGLAISRVIVENHNGVIGIFPDKKNTTFFIRLPLA